MSEPLTDRRETLRRAGAVAAGVAAGAILRPAAALAQSPDDEDLRDFLVTAIALEQVTVLAYSTAARGAAEAAGRRRLETFRDQEQAHANALRSALDELGFDPPEAPDSPTDTAVLEDVEGLDADRSEALTQALGRLADAEDEAALGLVLRGLETDQLGFYVEHGPALDSADLSRTAAEIAGCQAQHLVALGPAGAGPAAAVASASRTAARAAQAAIGSASASGE